MHDRSERVELLGGNFLEALGDRLEGGAISLELQFGGGNQNMAIVFVGFDRSMQLPHLQIGSFAANFGLQCPMSAKGDFSG